MTVTSASTTRVLVIVQALLNPTSSQTADLNYSINGVAPSSDANAEVLISSNASTSSSIQASAASFATITAGSNSVFALSYKATSTNSNFTNRTITVIPLN